MDGQVEVVQSWFASKRNIRKRIRRARGKRVSQRERCILALMLLYCAANVYSPKRDVWIRERNNMWWENIVMTQFTTSDWLSNFRMSQTTFTFIYHEIRGEISKEDTVMRKCICVKKRVAGWPVHDARVFANSGLYCWAQRGELSILLEPYQE